VSLVAIGLCFVGIAALPEPLRVWPVRGFFLAFIFGVIGSTTQYAFIGLDAFIRRQYGTALFTAAVIAGFAWLIQSCVRGMIIYR
jgi:hypothetical protein